MIETFLVSANMEQALGWLDFLFAPFARAKAPPRRIEQEPPGDCELCKDEIAVEGSHFCLWCQPGL